MNSPPKYSRLTITSNPLSLVSWGRALDRQIRVCRRKSEASLVKAIIFILMLKFLAKGLPI